MLDTFCFELLKVVTPHLEEAVPQLLLIKWKVKWKVDERENREPLCDKWRGCLGESPLRANYCSGHIVGEFDIGGENLKCV